MTAQRNKSILPVGADQPIIPNSDDDDGDNAATEDRDEAERCMRNYAMTFGAGRQQSNESR